MGGSFMDIEAPMCGYAPHIQALIDTAQSQNAPELDRLQARADLLNIRYGTDLEFYPANVTVNGRRVPNVYGYRYGSTSGGASDFQTTWRWLNGVHDGFELAASLKQEHACYCERDGDE